MSVSIFSDKRIPKHTAQALDAYVHERRPVGDFLYSVLTNNLKGAVGFADAENLPAIPAIVSYVVNHTPNECQGSIEKVTQWLAQGKTQTQSHS